MNSGLKLFTTVVDEMSAKKKSSQTQPNDLKSSTTTSVLTHIYNF